MGGGNLIVFVIDNSAHFFNYISDSKINKNLKKEDQRKLFSTIMDVSKALPAVLSNDYPVNISVKDGYKLQITVSLEDCQMKEFMDQVKTVDVKA